MNKSVYGIAAIVAFGTGWWLGQIPKNYSPEISANEPAIVVPSVDVAKMSEESRNRLAAELSSDWAELFASDELEPLVEALKKAGFAHGAIESYLTVRLQEEYGMYDIIYPMSERWWEHSNSPSQNGIRLMEVDRAVNQKVAELLGEKLETEGEARLRVHRFGDISRAKIEQIQRLKNQRSLDQMRRQEKGDGVSYAETEVAWHQSLREFLTDAEYRTYVVRNGDNAGFLKQQLQFLEVTEGQFESAAWELEMGHLEFQKTSDGDPVVERRASDNFLNVRRQIREILGDELYFEYTRANRGPVEPGSYQGIVSPAKILAAEELGFRAQEAVTHVYDAYSPDDPIRLEQAQAAFDRWANQTEQMMTAEEFAEYRESSDGRWLKHGRPRPLPQPEG